jgi:uncharacterized delta-60 repeat protein
MSRLTKSPARRRAAALGAFVSLGAVALAGGAASAASGDLDPGFGGAGHGRVEFDLGCGTTVFQGLAVQPGGGIVSVGLASADGGVTSDAVAYRLHADGTPDAGFGRVTLPGPSDVNEVARAAVAQPDGKVVVAGDVTDANGNRDIGVWRLTSAGALDTSFGSNGLVTYGRNDADEEAFGLALDPQGRPVVAGLRIGFDLDIAVLRLTPEGVPDPTFDNGQPIFAPLHTGTDLAQSVAVQPDGQILVAGTYAGAVNPVLRITPGTATTDAVLDPGFGGGDGIAEVPGTIPLNDPDVAVGAAGKVLLLGQVAAGGGAVDGTVVRLTSSGAVDDSFGSATGAHIAVSSGLTSPQSMTMLSHGEVAVLGYAGGGRSFVAKLLATGAPDPAMGPGGIRILPGVTTGSSAGVAALPDGRIVVVGNADDSTGVAYRLLGDFVAPSCAGKKATIVGTKAPDHLVGTGRADVIAGLGGEDTITGLGKGDIVCGGHGADGIVGGAGADHLYGQAGRDTLSGGKGGDKLVGGPGHDTLKGGPGRDTLTP